MAKVRSPSNLVGFPLPETSCLMYIIICRGVVSDDAFVVCMEFAPNVELFHRWRQVNNSVSEHIVIFRERRFKQGKSKADSNNVY